MVKSISEFQQKVLKAECVVPRDFAAAHNWIVRHLGIVNGAHAVDRVLATDSFPIIVSCHRAIQSGGGPGGYQDGKK